MTKENDEQASGKESVDILLAEHQRLSSLYLHNVEMGEKRTTSYLTMVTIGSTLLLGLSHFARLEIVLWASLGLVFGVFIFGLLTFQRLLERRIRAIEYLRAINRIHRFFVLKDPTIKQYFYWNAADDVPSFLARGWLIGRGTQLTGLRDIVAFFNILFAGIAIGEVLHLKWPDKVSYGWAVNFGLIGMVVVGLWHFRHERKILGRMQEESKKRVRFGGDALESQTVNPTNAP